jgi:hypothetical protein
MKLLSVLCAGLVLMAASCGGGGGSAAEAQCSSIVDAFARAWERCGRQTYDDAHAIFSDAFECETATAHDPEGVQQCVSDVDALSCAVVESGGSPASCAGVTD